MKLKGRLLEEVTLAEKRKLANTLRRKGFSWEDIQEAFRELGGFTEE
jgi:SOS response regulatory protein OraA/RecX